MQTFNMYHVQNLNGIKPFSVNGIFTHSTLLKKGSKTPEVMLKVSRIVNVNPLGFCILYRKRPGQAVFITSRVSGRGNRIGPVCVCVCVSVSTLTAEPFDL